MITLGWFSKRKCCPAVLLTCIISVVLVPVVLAQAYCMPSSQKPSCWQCGGAIRAVTPLITDLGRGLLRLKKNQGNSRIMGQRALVE